MTSRTTIDPRPPGNILAMSMLGVTWATCVTPRAKRGQDAQWLHGLPGVVCILDIFGRVHAARASDSVALVVGFLRASGVYDPGGRFRLAWSYCDGPERIALLEALFFKVAQ